MSVNRRIKQIRHLWVLFYTILIIVNLSSPTAYSVYSASRAYAEDGNINNRRFNNRKTNTKNDQDSDYENEDHIAVKQEIRESEEPTPYTEISSIEGSSNNLTANDTLDLRHSFDLNLTDTGVKDEIENTYNIQDISNYVNSSLEYDIKSITSIADNYTIELEESDELHFLTLENSTSSSYLAIAQAFEVKWDYALFYGAHLFLAYDAGTHISLRQQELDLFLVNSTTEGKPNVDNILSNATNNPFNQDSSYDVGLNYFDFQNVKLTSGKYFIVANLSKPDDEANRHFTWYYNEGATTGAETYLIFRDFYPQWTSSQPYDMVMSTFLLPCDVNEDPISFTDLESINLKDNGISIGTTSDTILTMGDHILSSNTSVQITFNNSYVFKRTFEEENITSNYQVSSSSFWEYEVQWTINWTSDAIDITPYSNLDRAIRIFAPTDWSNTYTFYDDTTTISGTKDDEGYLFSLGDDNGAGIWKLETTSPNYLYSSIFLNESLDETDRYFLGYWTTDGDFAYGHNGSSIFTQVEIKNNGDSTPEAELSGALNFTIFDPDGQIIPQKTDLSSELVYVDNTTYSLGGIVNQSAGYYETDITFDPSAYGSDPAGKWTASVLWQNGTQVGFYSQTIVVQTQTTFTAEWEETPDSDTWTTSNIARKNGDTLRINATYYNISEPFFDGYGNEIPVADVSYSTSWTETGSFNDFQPIYNKTLTIDQPTGDYIIDMVATGAFLENHTASFGLSVFFEADINPLFTQQETNFSKSAIFKFEYRNLTDPENPAILPDDLIVRQNDSVIDPAYYTFEDRGDGTTVLTIDTSDSAASMGVGYYDIEVEASKANFRASYTQQNVIQLFELTITPIITDIVDLYVDSSVYTYYNASLNFNYYDTNNTANIFGDSYVVYTNVSEYVYVSVEVNSSGYFVEIQNNNTEIAAIEVYVNISKTGYVDIEAYSLGIIEVLDNPTELLADPTNQEYYYIGYNTSLTVIFNDTEHNDLLIGATITDVSFNISSELYEYNVFEDLGTGYYTIYFICHDYTIDYLEIIIIIQLAGYEQAQSTIVLEFRLIPTDSSVDSDSKVTTYLDNSSFDAWFEDIVKNQNVSDAELEFSGDLLTVATSIVATYADETYTIDIFNVTQIGTYDLSITFYKAGYVNQTIIVTLQINERTTNLTPSATESTFNATEIEQFDFEYTDGGEEISGATIDVVFAIQNSSLIIDNYFESIVKSETTLTVYLVIFDPLEINATGYEFFFDITISKYGYQDQTITIHLIIIPMATEIDASSDTELTVYADEEGVFTIYYQINNTDTNIGDANVSIEQITGSMDDIDDYYYSEIDQIYYVTIDPNVYDAIGNSYQYNITITKAGYETQILTIQIHVIIHTTETDPENNIDEQQIYADEEGTFTLYYNDTDTGEKVTDATVTITPFSDYTGEISTTEYFEDTDYYTITVTPTDSAVSNTYSFNITFSKPGFENITITITLDVVYRPTVIGDDTITEVTIYADETGVFTINYTDSTTMEAITGAILDITQINGSSSNISSWDDFTFGDLYNITIDPVDGNSAGFVYEFSVNISKTIYESQLVTIYLTVVIHPTQIGASTETEKSIYADETASFQIYYVDGEEPYELITDASVAIIQLNGSEAEITLTSSTEHGTYYEIIINPNDLEAIGNVYEFNVTFSKDGFVEQYQVILLIVNYRPVDLTAEEDHIEIYADETGSFTIYYNDGDNSTIIPSAMINIVQLNGSAANITSAIDQELGSYYLITIDPVDGNSAGVTYEFSIEFYKDYYENTTISIFLTVVLHPTQIGASTETEKSIYADETASFQIYYVDGEEPYELITDASVAIIQLNGSEAEITLTSSTEHGTYYEIIINPNDLEAIGNVYEFNVTFSKDGFVEQYQVILLIVNYRPVDLTAEEDHIEIYADETGSFTIYYNDGDNSTIIPSAMINIVQLNGSAANITSAIDQELGSYYLITIDPVDGNSAGVTYEFSIEFYKDYYENTTISIFLTVVLHPTDVDYTDEVSISADETGTFEINYIETVANTSITSSVKINVVLFNDTADHIDSISNASLIGEIYQITIDPNNELAVGNVYLFNVTVYKDGFVEHKFVITLKVWAISTDIGENSVTTITIYADETAEFIVYYLDIVSWENISGVIPDIEQLNGTDSDINGISWSETSSVYYIVIDPNDYSGGYTYNFSLTLSKGIYQPQTIFLTLIVEIHPTKIAEESVLSLEIYSNENATFDVHYIEENLQTTIAGATVTITLLNETEDHFFLIEYDESGTHIYQPYISPVPELAAGNMYRFELTLSKPGYETQSVTLILYVNFHPTTIGSQTVTEQNITAIEAAVFTIYYLNVADNHIQYFNLSLLLLEGDMSLILSNQTSFFANYLTLSFSLNESLVAGETFRFNITLFKDGYVNQTLGLTINVAPRVNYDILIDILGDPRQLEYIQFELVIPEVSLQVLGTRIDTDYGLFSIGLNGQLIIAYIFVYANGETVENQEIININYDGVGRYRRLSNNIYIPRNVVEILPTFDLQLTNPSLSPLYNLQLDTQSVSTKLQASVMFPDIGNLLLYWYVEYTIPFIAVLAALFVLILILFFFFIVIRPRKQSYKRKQAQYRKKVVGILQSVMSMRKLIVVHQETSLPVYELDFGSGITVHSSLVTGFLDAVSSMGSEISGGQIRTVKKLDYGGFVVINSEKQDYRTYLFTTSDVVKDIEIGLSEFIAWFSKEFELKEDWNGVTDKFYQREKAIIDKISEKMFIWALHPFNFNESKAKDIRKLGSFSQRMVKFIRKTPDTTISLVLQFFDETPVDRTLATLFALMDSGYLIRKKFVKEHTVSSTSQRQESQAIRQEEEQTVIDEADELVEDFRQSEEEAMDDEDRELMDAVDSLEQRLSGFLEKQKKKLEENEK